MRIRNIILAAAGGLSLAGCANDYDDYGYGYGDRYYGDRYYGDHYYRDDGYYRDNGYYRDRDDGYWDGDRPMYPR